MTFDTFVSDPFLKFTFIFVFLGILIRIILFVYTIIINNKNKKLLIFNLIFSLFRLLFPLHKSYRSNLVTSILNIIFHLCLIIIPIWYSGHIILWTISRFQWYWQPLPNNLIDWMTILVICFLFFFLLRRIFVTSFRKMSTFSDYFLIIIVLLPFLSGYFLTHNFFPNVYLLNSYMQSIHIFTSEIFLIISVFLFWKPYINNKCALCDACTLACPTGALKYINYDNNKYIVFSHYACLGCGTCYSICPEKAIKLKHVISFVKFFAFNKKEYMYQLPLIKCSLCNNNYATNIQINNLSEYIDNDILHLCPSCRKIYIANQFLKKR